MSSKEESDLPNLQDLRKEFKQIQNHCLNCNGQTSPFCIMLNNVSEVQMNMQVGEFPVYCWRCAYGEIKVPLTIPLYYGSESEEENCISDNTESQTDSDTETVSDETTDNGYVEETSAIPATVQEGPSIAAEL